MIEILNNIGTLISMVFGVIRQPNPGASSEVLTILDFLFNTRGYPQSGYYDLRYILLLTFGVFMIGGAIGIFRRFLWKN